MTHELEGSPIHAAQVRPLKCAYARAAGGWSMILSDLKTLLETGSSLRG